MIRHGCLTTLFTGETKYWLSRYLATKVNLLKMKQQQHDINFEEDSEKKSESQMGLHSQVMTGTQELTNSIALSP